jgi:hypothetical protein
MTFWVQSHGAALKPFIGWFGALGAPAKCQLTYMRSPSMAPIPLLFDYSYLLGAPGNWLLIRPYISEKYFDLAG